MNVMIHDDIQSHYENMVDEVVSTHSEDILFRLARAMTDEDSLDALLQPQATVLLDHPVQGKSFSSLQIDLILIPHRFIGTCLNRMPSMIAKQLHDLHAKALATIEPTLDSFPFNQDTDMMQHLSQLNVIMDQKMMTVLEHHPLEHNVALALSACERQLAPPPRRSLWLLLKPFWKASASQMTQTSNSVPETTFLQSHLEAVAESLHLEFKLRLVDLYRTVQTDKYDDETASLL